MEILLNVLSISAGSFIGDKFKKRIVFKNFAILGISIMIISMVGFFENIFDIKDMSLKSSDLLVVVFSLVIGTVTGDLLRLENRINNLSGKFDNDFSSVIDAAVFFGVGGMQICGPVMLANSGDGSQLILKSMIDFPFALMFGMSYGKRTALSSIPVALGQIIVFILAVLSGKFLDEGFIKQICAVGYIILFFSGFNLVCEKKNKINNVNMLASILIIILYNAIIKLWGGI